MGNRIKGAAIVARKSFVETNFGSARWSEVLAALPASDQAVLRGIVTHSAWIPLEVEQHLDEAIVSVLAAGRTGVFEEIGARSARDNLGGVHRNFLRPGDPQAFLAQAATIYGFYYSSGRREYQATGPTSGVLTTIGAENTSVADCLTVIGWYREALAMCGAKNVEVVEEACRARGGACCRYRVSWS